MDWFYVYFVGFLAVIAAVGLAMSRLGIDAEWIVIVCLALFGVALMKAVRHTQGGED